ncbi:hypothetical protein OCU04_013041 [Sclerotinia nivalis]|uniref:Uncharacterized protein n=1 Tax=Sclerotinia nivalis TaxID=352851 RepID=A0A9X0DCW2_9HELO|nr:hypothetical protein OCU04_013041 [Sclerotinia nivalis]
MVFMYLQSGIKLCRQEFLTHFNDNNKLFKDYYITLQQLIWRRSCQLEAWRNSSTHKRPKITSHLIPRNGWRIDELPIRSFRKDQNPSDYQSPQSWNLTTDICALKLIRSSVCPIFKINSCCIYNGEDAAGVVGDLF